MPKTVKTIKGITCGSKSILYDLFLNLKLRTTEHSIMLGYAAVHLFYFIPNIPNNE